MQQPLPLAADTVAIWPLVIPIGCAVIASLTALFVALQNRRWAKADRAADRAAANREIRRNSQAQTVRKVAEEMFDFDPVACPVAARDGAKLALAKANAQLSEGDLVSFVLGITLFVTPTLEAFAADVRSGIATIEPLRRWATTLPLAWRIRIDCELSLIAHFGSPRTVAWLRRDLADLMNGEEAPARLSEDDHFFFVFYLSALLTTPRYVDDPVLGGVADQLARVCVVDALGSAGAVAAGDKLADGENRVAHELLADIVGRRPALTA